MKKKESINANFKISQKDWIEFVIQCKRKGTNASVEIRKFIKTHTKRLTMK